MPDTTAPSGSVDASPMSFDEGVSAIENLLGDVPETDSVEDAKANPAAEVTDELKGDEDDALLSALSAETEGEVEKPTDAPTAVPDTAMVTLEDGTSISIADLKTNHMFQRVFTQKTQELARHKDQLDADFKSRVSEAENEIRQKRDLILENFHLIVPKEPVYDPADPVGYVEDLAQYQERMKVLNTLYQQKQQEETQRTEQQQKEAEEFAANEWNKFLSSAPALKTPEKLKAFQADVGKIAVEEYKLSREELQMVTDSRYMRVLHDAIQYQKLKAKAAAVPSAVAAKPKLVQQQRMAPQAIQNRDRQGRFEAHRQNGSIDSAARAIEDFL